MRDALPYEADAIDALVGGIEPDQFAKFGDDTVICRKLSMLIRPTLVPEDPDNAFVWGDWSQIEARILPWLAGSEARLDIFREVDRDPSLPDLYTRSSASMSGLPIEKIDKPLRQRGKVAELACGFGGGRNALQNMAANYNMFLDNGQAAEIVREWREANPWAVDYWAKLWEAFLRAYEAPGHLAEVGAVGYIFLKDYLGGTMLCRLPSGRFLTYRRVKWERIDEVDDNDVIVDSRWELTFARAFGRIKLWPGFLCENIVQASAADVLRGTLVRVIASPSMPMVRAHTHDELLLEQHVDRCDDTAERLTAEMERGFDWSVGLPLKAEPTIAYCYTKCEEAQGL
jgi:DNA polymerase